MTTVSTERGFGMCYGGRGSEFARCDAHSHDGLSLDLTDLYNLYGADYCRKIAERWGRANGLIKAYRRKASHRRFLARIRSR